MVGYFLSISFFDQPFGQRFCLFNAGGRSENWRDYFDF